MKRTFRRTTICLSLLAGAVVVLALGTSVAPAATTQPKPSASGKPCAEAIIDDWYPDGRVNALYAIPCYEEAIKSLPLDLRVYGQAEEDIRRAQQFAKDRLPDPGRTAATTSTGTDTTATDTSGGPGGGGTGEGPPTSADSSSLPVPLIVLGGLAVLLFAAGGAGYLNRRLRRQDVPEDNSLTDP